MLIAGCSSWLLLAGVRDVTSTSFSKSLQHPAISTQLPTGSSLFVCLATPPGRIRLAIAMEMFTIAIGRGGLRGSCVGVRGALIAASRLDVPVLVLPPIRIRHLFVFVVPRRTLIRFRAWLVIHKSSVSRFLVLCDPRRISAFRRFTLDMIHTALARSGHDTLIAHPVLAHFSSNDSRTSGTR